MLTARHLPVPRKSGGSRCSDRAAHGLNARAGHVIDYHHTVSKAKAITAPQAAELYDQLGRGSWQADSLAATCLAVEVELRDHLARAVLREERRCKGVRAGGDRALPDWVRAALPDYLHAAHELKPSVGLLSGVTEPEFLGVLIELLRTGSIGLWVRALDDGGRTELKALFKQTYEHFKPAQRAALQAFYVGVRMHFRQQGWGDPKPSEVRLLAAARELAPITDGLDRARKQWEDRLRRWRKELDGPFWSKLCVALDAYAAEHSAAVSPRN